MGPAIRKGLELAVFAAWIRACGKIGSKRLVKVAPTKLEISVLDPRRQVLHRKPLFADHLLGQRLRGNAPDGKKQQRFQSGVFQLALTVGANVGLVEKGRQKRWRICLRQRLVAGHASWQLHNRSWSRDTNRRLQERQSPPSEPHFHQRAPVLCMATRSNARSTWHEARPNLILFLLTPERATPGACCATSRKAGCFTEDSR